MHCLLQHTQQPSETAHISNVLARCFTLAALPCAVIISFHDIVPHLLHLHFNFLHSFGNDPPTQRPQLPLQFSPCGKTVSRKYRLKISPHNCHLHDPSPRTQEWVTPRLTTVHSARRAEQVLKTPAAAAVAVQGSSSSDKVGIVLPGLDAFARAILHRRAAAHAERSCVRVQRTETSCPRAHGRTRAGASPLIGGSSQGGNVW